MAEKWTRDEDELLILFQSNGLNAKKIYEKFGNRFNSRSQRSIENRISYLINVSITINIIEATAYNITD